MPPNRSQRFTLSRRAGTKSARAHGTHFVASVFFVLSSLGPRRRNRSRPRPLRLKAQS
jgi:hypothetical protein